jgi:hypothetical protein
LTKAKKYKKKKAYESNFLVKYTELNEIKKRAKEKRKTLTGAK